MLLGITGMPGSGKDTAADFLKTWRGLATVSLSDLMREEIRKEKGADYQMSDAELIAYGNALREKYGPGVLGERALEKIKSDKNGVVTSIRNPSEVLALKKRKDFVLVNITAAPDVRYQRLLARKRDGEIYTREKFDETERKQNGATPNEQQMNAVMNGADHTIENNGTLKELHERIDTFLNENGEKYALHRPGWDEYYLSMLPAIARRSTCDRGRSGCIITLDNRVLMTGYVGSPPGVPHCDEIGHAIQKVLNADGTTTEHCVRTAHAEMNAITQAARNGIALDGATLYCSMVPCFRCAGSILGAGIIRVVAAKEYQVAQQTRDMFKFRVKLDVATAEVENYSATKPS